MFKRIIRVLLALALLYGVYRETGIFTVLCLFLIFLAIELPGWQANKKA